MENLNRFYESMKRILSMKKTKITLYIAAVLWLAVATQMFMNRFFYKEVEITQAFVNTNTGELKSSIEIIADYEKDYLSETDKKDLIQYLADAIGLNVDKDITFTSEGSRSEYAFEKQARNATTQLKIVSLEQAEEATVKMKHYIVVRLNIKDSIQSIDKYRKLLEGAMQKLGVDQKQVTLQYEGSFNGTLSTEEKDRISELLVKELQGETALRYEEEGIYTVYAYTGLINEYIVSAGSKVNIQIAITYDEQTQKTTVYLATPILNQSW
jgi:hypothetical protein